MDKIRILRMSRQLRKQSIDDAMADGDDELSTRQFLAQSGFGEELIEGFLALGLVVSSAIAVFRPRSNCLSLIMALWCVGRRCYRQVACRPFLISWRPRCRNPVYVTSRPSLPASTR